MNRALGIIALMVIIIAAPARAAGAGGGASIEKIVLQVEDATPGSNSFRPSSVGKTLPVGSKVRTGKRAKAELMLTEDKSVIRLAQLSDVTIEPNREINVPKGTMKFDFKSPARIRAGSTVADVRGSAGGITIPEKGGEISGVMTAGVMTLKLNAAATASGDRPLLRPVSNDYLGAGEIEIRAGQRFRFNPQTGQIVITPAPSGDYSDASGEVVETDELSDAGFAGGEVYNTAGGPAGAELFESDTTIVQQMAADVPVTESPTMTIFSGGEIIRGGDVVGNILPPQSGGLNISLSNRVLRQPTGTTPTPSREIQRATGSGAQRGYFAPRFDGNFFIYEGTEGTGSAAFRFRHYGAYRRLYYEVATVPNLRFRGAGVRVDTTDAYATLKMPGAGELKVGRQRFLQGPVQNTVFGTLLRQGGRDVQDAVTFSPRYGTAAFSTDLSYIIDAFPTGTPASVPGSQNGFLMRNSYSSKYGTFGFNLTEGNFLNKVGTTFDWSVPAIKGVLDFYGEAGDDGFGNDIRTFGVYFPGIYEKFEFDVFVEQSNLRSFGRATGTPLQDEWVMRVYKKISGKLVGLMTLDNRKTTGTSFGLGLVYKITFK